MATSQSAPNGDSPRTAPYIPFKSFSTALDRLKLGHPPTIDSSFFHGMSGGTQRQIILALKFFGLVGDGGEVSQELDVLAKAEDRRSLIGDLIRNAYSTVFGIGLEHATPNQFNDALREYNVSGSTLEKARSFFLQAAKFAGVTLSPGIQHLSKRGASGGKRRSSSRNREDIDDDTDDQIEDVPTLAAPTGESLTVNLQSGGTITLTASTSFIKMSSQDRQFVFRLIDELQGYESTGGLG
jgi:hypothetical protein